MLLGCPGHLEAVLHWAQREEIQREGHRNAWPGLQEHLQRVCKASHHLQGIQVGEPQPVAARDAPDLLDPYNKTALPCAVLLGRHGAKIT